MNSSAKSSPTRIVVRDAPFSQEWREKWRKAIQAGLPFLEEKTENIINRKSGTAVDPRTGERIPPGAAFDGEIVLHIYEDDDAGDFSKLIRRALAVIQEGSSLGASGSRGYGKVRFEKLASCTKKLAELTI